MHHCRQQPTADAHTQPYTRHPFLLLRAGTQPFYTLTKDEQKTLLKGASDGGTAKQVPYLPESIYLKLSGVLDGDASVLPHVKLSVGSAAKPSLDVRVWLGCCVWCLQQMVCVCGGGGA